jgi:3-ketosteroid 9alpha-monooxygenase subunit B
MMETALQTSGRFHPLKVKSVVEETADAKSLIFEIPAELSETYLYKPGQFLTLRLPVGGKWIRRCYSMSSAPDTDELPRVTIKRILDGKGSNWVCNQVRAGDTIYVSPPAGVFTPRSMEGDFLLIGGGSGITPILSILRSALNTGRGRITLFYANRDDRSVIFREELKSLANRYADRLVVLHWLDSVQGTPSVVQLSELFRQYGHTEAFVCGPGPFMETAIAALSLAELADDRVHVERFVSLPDEDFNPEPNSEPSVAGIETAELELRLDGDVHHLTCQGNETLLEAAIRSGINAPFSCQAGMCAACMCQVKEGQVHLRHNDVLDEKDLSKSWTLACQAVPLSPFVRIQFPE